MDLQEKLNDRRKQFEATALKEDREIMHRATDDLRASGILDRVLREGDEAPDFILNNAYGRRVSLSERLTHGPVVLGFYRGRW